MGVGSFTYLNSNYVYGITDHANGMASSIPWASVGIATDAMSLMQLLGTSGATAMGATAFAAGAATPIINVGLNTLTGASNTLGFGRPEDGERFTDSAQQFTEANTTLQDSVPAADWQGGARDAYRDRNIEQQQRTIGMATFDGRVQAVLAKEAGEVDSTRDFVSKCQTMLAAAIPAAIAARFIPPAGTATSVAIEVAAVAATVPVALKRTVEMVSHANDNADVIRQITSHYQTLGERAQMPGGMSGAPSGPPSPLTVSDSIRATASVQQSAADTIEAAKSKPDGSAGDVFKTHGLVCTLTAAALKSAELARRSAAGKMHLISTDLAVKLGLAATEYAGTDRQNADNLDLQMPAR
jgi:hypothetical protein